MKKNYLEKFYEHFIKRAAIVAVLLSLSLNLFASANFQWKRFDLDVKNGSLETVLLTIEKETGCNIVYINNVVSPYQGISINKKGGSVKEILDEVLKGTNLKYSIVDNVITISSARTETQVQNSQQTVKKETYTGRVIDLQSKKAIEGIVVLIIGTTNGTITDAEGKFSLQASAGERLEFSSVGYEAQVVTLKPGEKNIEVKMVESQMDAGEIVVTSIYSRPKESFTGSYSSFNKNDLKKVGSQNIIQSLKTLDPSFAVLENNQFGSDPNRLPNIEIRGKSSMMGMRDELVEDPNQPLFILDGFETTLRAIYDLDMDRVLSITLLKDASSTAIYGSKAANGVVIVETVRPQSGKLRLSYNGNVNVNMPDLSSYNMMNAEEKLRFEMWAGRYSFGDSGWSAEKEIEMNSNLYNKQFLVGSGVDTDWMSQPVRVGVDNRHSLYAEGGEGAFTFGLGLGINSVNGVMKKSERTTVNGNVDLAYRVSKFLFANKLTVGQTNSKDPISSFSDYVNANPYFPIYDQFGEVNQWLEYNDFFKSPNPLWNDIQNSRIGGKSKSFSNYFSAEYNPLKTLKIRAKFGYSLEVAQNEKFISRNDTRYDEKVDWTDRGSYDAKFVDNQRYEAELTATYGKTFGKHQINLVGGGNLSSIENIEEGYGVIGFPEGDFTYPSFSKGYREGGRSVYGQSVSRQISAFINGNYSYDNRYLFDVSYRINGSSVFGSTKRYTDTWSVGIGWNIHREKFIEEGLEKMGIKMFKLRASIGSLGNQNFDAFKALTTYMFNYSSLNYFGMSSTMSTLGNPFLQWQKTIDKNIGLDLTLLDNRVNVVLDAYNKKTDPLLVAVAMPSSSGVVVNQTNIGNQVATGFQGTLGYYPLYKPSERITLQVRATFRTSKTILGGVGNKLDDMNKLGQKNNTTARYYDGADPDAIWAVPSKGIDPANGREIFITKSGDYTYDYNKSDEVVVGRDRPDLEGVLGTTFNYKGFSFGVNFRYRMGGQSINRAAFNKVENLSREKLNYNQDRRALLERWKVPGDLVQFRDIANFASTPMSSRFVQNDNTLSLESVNIGYEIPKDFVKKYLGLSTLRASVNMNELFRLSTIRTERGTIYPFARTMSFSLSASF